MCHIFYPRSFPVPNCEVIDALPRVKTDHLETSQATFVLFSLPMCAFLVSDVKRLPRHLFIGLTLSNVTARTLIPLVGSLVPFDQFSPS